MSKVFERVKCTNKEGHKLKTITRVYKFTRSVEVVTVCTHCGIKVITEEVLGTNEEFKLLSGSRLA